MTLGELHRQIVAELASASIDSAPLDARWLIAGVLGIDRAAVLTAPERTLGEQERARVQAAVARRVAREPVSRILGARAFHGLDLEVGPATLDPRPDTEVLVDALLGLVQAGDCSGGATPRIVDLGTGTGAIAIALLKALPGATALAIDIDADSLAVARRNAERHGVGGRLTLRQGHWLDGVTGPFDIVASNPPYIPSHVIEALEPEVRRYDPRLALDGGSDGLGAYREIVPAALAALGQGGWLALEAGHDQIGQLVEMINAALGQGTCGRFRRWPDLSGRVRCVAVQTRSG